MAAVRAPGLRDLPVWTLRQTLGLTTAVGALPVQIHKSVTFGTKDNALATRAPYGEVVIGWVESQLGGNIPLYVVNPDIPLFSIVKTVGQGPALSMWRCCCAASGGWGEGQNVSSLSMPSHIFESTLPDPTGIPKNQSY